MPPVSPPPSDSLTVSCGRESATTHRKCDPVSRTPPFNSPLLRHTALVDPSCSKSTAVSKKKRRDPNYIPRPPNCFFLFRKHFIANLPEGYTHPTKTKSKLAGEAWNALPASEKQKWYKIAHEVSVEHAKKYPDWKYSPTRKSDKRRRAGKTPTSKHRVGVVTPPPQPLCGPPPSIPEGGLEKEGPAPSSSRPYSRMPPPNYNLSYSGDRPEVVPAHTSAMAHLLSHRGSIKTSFQAPPSHGDEFAQMFEGHQVACTPKDIPHDEFESSNHPSQRYEGPLHVTPISQPTRGYRTKLDAWKTMSGHGVTSTSPPTITSRLPVPMGTHANSTSPVHVLEASVVQPAVPSDDLLQEQARTMPDSLDTSFARFGASQLDVNLHPDAGCIVHGTTLKPLTTPDELFLVGKPQSDSFPSSPDLTQQSGELYLSGLDGLDGANAVVDPQHQDGEEDSLLGPSFSMTSQEELHDFWESMTSFYSSYPCSDSPLD